MTGQVEGSRRKSEDVITSLIFPLPLFTDALSPSPHQVNTFELLADHPDILAKVREEQYRIRDNDVDAPLTLEMVDSMTYTRAMIKEALRVLPPVIMVCPASFQLFSLRLLFSQSRLVSF